MELSSCDIRLYRLLSGIKEYGSIYKAIDGVCAYSCAWNSLKDYEDKYGVKLLDRMGQSGSELTAAGEIVLSYLNETNALVSEREANMLKELQCL